VGRKQIEIAVLGVLIIGVILYAGTGIVYAGALSSSAEHTLSTVVSHQNALNTSFNEIDSEVAALGGSGTFDPQQAVGLVDRSVTSSQVAASRINMDDSSLASVQGQLDSSRWLTLVGHTTVDRESARVGHARKALAAARMIAADQVLDGHFWHALYTALGQLDTLNNQSGSGDFTSAKATLAAMQADVVQAVQQSTAPGLPPDLHSLMLDLQTFVSDFGKQLDAQIAGDDATVVQYQTTLDGDRNKLGTYNVDKIGSDIDAFYRPLIERFNSEIAAATS
jgi:type II secretory pathway component PulM